MTELRFLWLSLSLVLLVGRARADCQIPPDTMSTNHVFLSYEKNGYDLLRSDIVAASKSIYLLCGGEAAKKYVCVLKSFTPALPTTDCRKALKIEMEPTHDLSCPSPFTMYRVGYTYGDRFLEIYRICYDKVQNSAQFSIHKVYHSIKTAPRTSMGYTLDGVMTSNEAAAFSNKNINNCFEADLDNGQKYKQSSPCLFHRGHLATVADFPFKHMQKATFKLINVVPQYGAVNNGNWKSVEFWVRRLLVEKNYDFLNVCTGALGVKQTKSQRPMFLRGNKIPLPEWTYKIVSHRSGAHYVMLTYNDPGSIYKIQNANPESICKRIPCDSNLNGKGKGTTFCCDPVPFINKNLKHLKGIC